MPAWNDPWSNTVGPDGFAAGLAMGMLEAKRADVVRAIQLRFCTDVPSELSVVIRGMDNLDQLDRWLDAALTAPGIDAFRTMTSWADNSARRG